MVAINKNERKEYVELIASLVAANFRYLLESHDYDQADFEGPPMAISTAELHELFGKSFRMELLVKEEFDKPRFGDLRGFWHTTILSPLRL